jgi:hypothetical protein
MPPHPDLFPRGGEGTCKGREGMKGKILKTPSPLPSPAEWRGKSEDGKVLMDKIKGELGNGRVMAGL